MSPAAPRRKAKGPAAILPTRIGVSAGRRPWLDSSTAVTGSGRSGSITRPAWAPRGTRSRRAFPARRGSSRSGLLANPATRGSFTARPMGAPPAPASNTRSVTVSVI